MHWRVNKCKHSDTNVIAFWAYILHIRESLNKFPDFYPIDTFIDSTHIKL